MPGLRMVVVAGPAASTRRSLPEADGLEVRGYVHEPLPALAAAATSRVVQGGLTTTMELVAAGRPFVSFPLRDHFEQRVHVRHRLDRHGARAWLDYADATPGALADAIAGAIGTTPGYRPVPGRRGAGRGAARGAGARAR